jgi:hypothetical protein
MLEFKVASHTKVNISKQEPPPRKELNKVYKDGLYDERA